jgi:hypothetical protein
LSCNPYPGYLSGPALCACLRVNMIYVSNLIESVFHKKIALFRHIALP